MNNDQLMREVGEFCEHAKRDPRILVAGGAVAVTLAVIGAPKVVALVGGAMVAGGLYSNAKRLALRGRC